MQKEYVNPEYVELRFRVKIEVKKQLDMLGQVTGISAHKMAAKIICQNIGEEQNSLDVVRRAEHLEKKLEPLYFRIFGSYSNLAMSPVESESFLERCRDFKQSADLFVDELKINKSESK